MLGVADYQLLMKFDCFRCSLDVEAGRLEFFIELLFMWVVAGFYRYLCCSSLLALWIRAGDLSFLLKVAFMELRRW